MFGFKKNENIVRDPICGMKVDKEKTEYFYEKDGEIFYFCSEHCKDTFIEKL
jgi:YHS domain-containing protein